MSITERLQPHTVGVYKLCEDNLQEKWVDARLLLHPTRFDLFAKLYYVRNRMDNKAEAVRVYKEHIKAFNPDLKEPGREDKSGYDDFLSSFDALIENFREKDFDASLSLVPVTDEYVILDGAHRVAALAYHGKKVGVACCQGVHPKAMFNYRYFRDRGLSWGTMDLIANEMTRWVPNMYVACLWPKMVKKDKAIAMIEEKFGIVYEKSLRVNLASFKSLIKRVYDSQPWVNAPESVNHKSLQCYDFKGQITFLFFAANSIEDVLAVKDSIRGIYGSGKHSLHITDNAEETRAIANMVLLEDERTKWYGGSAMGGLKEKVEERWFYFKKVQFLKLKVAIARMIGR